MLNEHSVDSVATSYFPAESVDTIPFPKKVMGIGQESPLCFGGREFHCMRYLLLTDDTCTRERPSLAWGLGSARPGDFDVGHHFEAPRAALDLGYHAALRHLMSAANHHA